MKQIPTDVDNFMTLIDEDYYYIDKTSYIRALEAQKKFILLVRPRRMGKTLFSSMMMTYYDINAKEQFNHYFGNLSIGENPTSLANAFFVLQLDFSKVEGYSDDLPAHFREYCFYKLIDFFDRYPGYYTPQQREQVLSSNSVKNAIVRLVDITHLMNKKLYLFIDEYDNFTNVVLAARGVKAHEEITHGDGFYRDFFKGLKGTFDRIFMTGVSPVTYDDLTSGFSIADMVSLMPRFNAAVGITEAELRAMINYYREGGHIECDPETLIAEMKPWYDNFCFSDESYGLEPTIYNTQSVLRYLRDYISQGKAPRALIDRDARVDYQKLDFLVKSEDLKNRKRREEIIREICATGSTYGYIEEKFPASEVGDEANFKSMLFYYGTLSFNGWNEDGLSRLTVTNRTMADLYLRYLLDNIVSEDIDIDQTSKEMQATARIAAVDGNWEPLAEKIGEIVKRYSSLRNIKGGEYDVQGFLRGLLCFSPYFAIWPELELNMGYSDLLLVPKNAPTCPTLHSYLIELKYMKPQDKDVKHYVDEACDQLKRYISDTHLEESPLLRGTPLTPLYLVFRNHQLVAKGNSTKSE